MLFALQSAELSLLVARTKLDAAIVEVAALEDRHAHLMQTEHVLASQIQSAKLRSSNAATLLEGLSTELSSWNLRRADLAATLDRAVGDTLLATACIVYCGPLPSALRYNIIQQWYDILKSSDFQLSALSSRPIFEVFSSAQQRRQWDAFGLSPDAQSIDNAVMLFSGQVRNHNSLHASVLHCVQPNTEAHAPAGIWSRTGSSLPPCAPLVQRCPLIIDPTGVTSRYGF